MVEWTEEERVIIKEIFSKLKYEDVGPKSLCRVLVVYPWTQRYFASFGTLYNPEMILANRRIVKHGVVVFRALELALKNLDNIKNTYAELSKVHSEKLQVDPDNFQLLADCITIVIATKMRSAFTPEKQAAWYKFLTVVVSALSRQYY